MKNNNSNDTILSENSQRNTGKTAQRMNILAAKLVAEAVRTTLGPKGMDKMLVDTLGEIIVTNDGVTILKEMDVEHPAAKMIIEVAKTQEEEVGDGTTTAVILAGELLRKAEQLLDQNIHATIITKGYQMAAEQSIKILNNMAKDTDEETLKKICETAMTGKGSEDSKETLSKLLIKATKILSNETESLREKIIIQKKTGTTIKDSELIKGLVIDKEKTHSSMPKKITNAKIALIESPIEVKSTDIDTKITINDPAKIQEFLDVEEKMIKNMINKITETNANVIFCQKGIDDLAQHLLQKKGIYACRRVKKSDMAKIAQATGASLISDINDIKPEDLGTAGTIKEVKVNEEHMTYIEDCTNTKIVTILVRGTTTHIVEEAARAAEDALGDIATALKEKKAVGGAASTEILLSKKLKEYSQELNGREQLAVQAFSESLEIIPKTLAENAGLDPIDVLTELNSNLNKITWPGINITTGKVIDAWEAGIIEPLKTKTQAIMSSTEVATMILRIDDVILANTNNKQQNQPDIDNI
ncbi:thermosome subunit [Candidatus Woesearchaeota archaeon]|nr:thermosome subunit [Candidatus Woesearchaeota archaeon]